MSLIDDVVGKKIPTGKNFQAKVGPGSLKNKLYAATSSGALSNLRDNKDLIEKIAKKRQDDIRAGKYNKDKMEADYNEALCDPSLTNDDKKDLRAVLSHWKNGAKVENTTQVKKPSKADKRAAAIKKELNPSPIRDLPDFLQKRPAASVNTNPWSNPSSLGGSGGGIGAGANQGKLPRRPSLLK